MMVPTSSTENEQQAKIAEVPAENGEYPGNQETIVDPLETPYAEYIRKVSTRKLQHFDESASEYRLCGTQIHSLFGTVVVGLVGLLITLAFCVVFGFFHNRYGGDDRNSFVDTVELLEVLFAFFVGLPSHYAVFYAIHSGNKRFLSPFVIYYCINFCINVMILVIIVAAFVLDIQHHFLGHIQFDVSWIIIEVVFIVFQAIAIYVVMVYRRYLDAKEHFNRKHSTQSACHNNETPVALEAVTSTVPVENSVQNGKDSVA